MKVVRKRFVIHEHHARNLHFDLRLEIDGVLKSWAVPKGPSMRAADKRLAIAVPDHSLNYIDYEGTISEGSYGAGEVRVWDDGKYETQGNPLIQYEAGKIVFSFFGLKLRGEFVLVRVYGKDDQWLLIKAHDHWANPDWQLQTILPAKDPEGKRNKSRSSKAPAYHTLSSLINRRSSRRREA